MAKIIRDPIHNIIEVEDDVINLIDTYAFQRLRRIRQLGVAWLVYPAAEHSRLTHSLGVYGMSKRIINALKQNSKKFNLEKEEEKLITIAALLHDIGHGPFSHAFENVIKNLGGFFDHEKMSIQIIKECQDITERLQKCGENFADKVCQILNKEYSNTHVGSIISSQFDADRIDYLLRDSYMTGANYGKFDVDWLLKNISIEKATFPTVEGQTVVCINYNKGLNVLEQYILGRYYMYVHVYYHKVIRAFETIIYNVIKRVIKEEHDKLVGYQEIKALYSGNVDMDLYLKLDDFTVIGWFNEWYYETNDPILKELLHYFFCRKPFYKVIYPSAKPNEYSSQKDKVLKQFDTEEQREYFFYEDTPTNVAYKSLYLTKGVSDEIFVYKNENEIIPLSAVEDTVISQAGSTLSKDIIRWYIKV
ncbi:HD domain-containing protein [Desulfallas thermosapovorans]|uniref:HD domain-containing protein n=1 Tax=Desulfallas thermosapovorans DSM 6562 TaxID=1121431 RepID=A0A5S4ZUE7_9FIRM|nr:HD domain-containing protein [Desulfallas thermosapovorans]TYO96607.1 hypothetical protein LX24_01076 [Desulfallas thermosapovorans DSM 6562]